jgi:hypothetical protein
MGLARNPNWQGLSVDGSGKQVAHAEAPLPNAVKVVQRFPTLDNLDFINTTFPKIGVLPIDVDGNDYWFLESLIGVETTIICVGLQCNFGLEPITV